MKKSFAFLAVLTAIAGAASAQSSVSLSGLVDLNLRHSSNGDTTQNSVSTNGIGASQIRFQGSDQLSSTAQASFWLEQGINPDTGSAIDAAKPFNRRSTLSLSEQNLGELRLGRYFTAQYLGYGNFDPFGDTGIGASSNLTSALGSDVSTGFWSDNTIGYFLPENSLGLYGQIEIALKEGAASGKQYRGGTLGWTNNQLNVAATLGSTDITGGKYKNDTIAASYTLVFGTLYGHLNSQKNTANDQELQRYLIGASVPVGAGEVRASYASVNASGAGTDANDASQIALGYVHNLSKRTAVYGNYSHIDNKGAAAFGNNSLVAVAGQNSNAVEFGIRHAF
ncbi:porin [Malikia sp.]|uniref:porin n=1 Tax=Malikia sp. TaxID=2070706 RepID=UPI00262DBE99|nr:porin [Malikia sp.]MDD2730042.1 porin [Malikia sp.]